ncbi:MAG: signal recognition particle-docking protein FtsY, partial [Trueperaceae bacterium]|nr:signal recognition particle-docking protein FtsY [Trueperaceae bacterium]
SVDGQADVLLVDTAGRLHTKVNLMDEIKKVKKTIGKALDGAPHETLLVIDATTGQNALTQAALFKEALELTGLILTKLDGTAKGGVVLGVCDELKVPVRYIGLGERAEDLREFVAADFVEALFGKDDDEAAAA